MLVPLRVMAYAWRRATRPAHNASRRRKLQEGRRPHVVPGSLVYERVMARVGGSVLCHVLCLLESQVPDLVLGPRQPLDSGELQQAGRRDTTRSFGMRSKACIDWAASAVTPARQSLEWTSTDGRRARGALMSTSHTKGHDVFSIAPGAGNTQAPATDRDPVRLLALGGPRYDYIARSGTEPPENCKA